MQAPIEAATAVTIREIVHAVMHCIAGATPPPAIAVFDEDGTSMLWSSAAPLPVDAHAALRAFLASDRDRTSDEVRIDGCVVRIVQTEGDGPRRYAVIAEPLA